MSQERTSNPPVGNHPDFMILMTLKMELLGGLCAYIHIKHAKTLGISEFPTPPALFKGINYTLSRLIE